MATKYRTVKVTAVYKTGCKVEGPRGGEYWLSLKKGESRPKKGEAIEVTPARLDKPRSKSGGRRYSGRRRSTRYS